MMRRVETSIESHGGPFEYKHFRTYVDMTFLFCYVELVSKICPYISVTPCTLDIKHLFLRSTLTQAFSHVFVTNSIPHLSRSPALPNILPAEEHKTYYQSYIRFVCVCVRCFKQSI
jgi:hypothetical protein